VHRARYHPSISKWGGLSAEDLDFFFQNSIKTKIVQKGSPIFKNYRNIIMSPVEMAVRVYPHLKD
jgi:hypothetical protein